MAERKNTGRRVRRPDVTEQVAHAKLSHEVAARKAAAEIAEPEPPPGHIAVSGGWWPESWCDEREDGTFVPMRGDDTCPQLIALGQLVKLALTHPGIGAAERAYYRDAACRASHLFTTITRPHAEAWVVAKNAAYEDRP